MIYQKRIEDETNRPLDYLDGSFIKWQCEKCGKWSNKTKIKNRSEIPIKCGRWKKRHTCVIQIINKDK